MSEARSGMRFGILSAAATVVLLLGPAWGAGPTAHLMVSPGSGGGIPGGPNCSVHAAEGDPVVLDAECPLGPAAPGDEHRWDLDGDGMWDTTWANGTTYASTWGDDFRGPVGVERGREAERTEIALEAPAHAVGPLSPLEWVLQTIVPSRDFTLVKVAVDVSINWGNPTDLHVWIRDGLEANGTNLSHGQLPSSQIPRYTFADPKDWPVVNMSGLTLEAGRTYYVMLNHFPPTTGVYQVAGVGLLRPDWPLFEVDRTQGWRLVRDPDDNLGLRVYARDIAPTAKGVIDITVENVQPALDAVTAAIPANLTLRVSGERWHDVRVDLVWNRGITGTARVVRTPGSPDRQAARIEGGRIELLGDFRIILYYTPADDAANGRPNGANPVWVIMSLPDGSGVRLHHTFNVQQPSTWTWTISDLRTYVVRQRIVFRATAHDVGSDDLTVRWSFGDGPPDAATIHYNNGCSADPYPSTGVGPITVTDFAAHTYAAAGAYAVTLTVTDDDGGLTVTAFALLVGS